MKRKQTYIWVGTDIWWTRFARHSSWIRHEIECTIMHLFRARVVQCARRSYTTQSMVQTVYYSPVHTQQNSCNRCNILILIYSASKLGISWLLCHKQNCLQDHFDPFSKNQPYMKVALNPGFGWILDGFYLNNYWSK